MTLASNGVAMRQLAPLPKRSVRNNAALSKFARKSQQLPNTTYITQSHYIYHYGPSCERQYGFLDIEEVDADETPDSDNVEIIVGEFEDAPSGYTPRTTFIPAYTAQQGGQVCEGDIRQDPTFTECTQRPAATEQSINSSTAMKRSFSEQQLCDRDIMRGTDKRNKRARSEEPAKRTLDDSIMDMGE